MKKTSGAMLIVLVALAVPGVLFYNWWAKQSEAQRAELQRKVKNRLPPGTPMFGNPPPQAKLDNPLDRPQQAAAIPASTQTVAAVSPSTAAALGSNALPNAPKDGGLPPAAAQTPAPPPAPAAAQPATPVPVAEVVIDSTIALAKDPMLSPYDMVRIDQAKLEDEMRKKEIAQGGPRKRVVRHVVEHPVENDIDLQGIVTTDEGNKAIVNGEMIAEGELVKGAKVIKITPQTVVFTYRGRRFSKSISK